MGGPHTSDSAVAFPVCLVFPVEFPASLVFPEAHPACRAFPEARLARRMAFAEACRLLLQCPMSCGHYWRQVLPESRRRLTTAIRRLTAHGSHERLWISRPYIRAAAGYSFEI